MPKRLNIISVLCLSASLQGGLCFASSFTWTGAVSSDWFNQNNWSPVGVPGMNDTVNVSTGSISFSSPVTFGGQFNWSGGEIVSGSLTIASNGILNIAGNVTVGGGGNYALTNSGTVNWMSGAIVVRNCAVINQTNGLWNIECDQALNPYFGNEAFVNAGELLKLAATNTTTINVIFDNTGQVNAQTGTIQFNSGGSQDGSFQAATDGVVTFANGSFVFGGEAEGPGNVQITGGTISGSFSGTMNWSGGQITETLTVASNGVLNINGNVTVAFPGYPGLTNFGTVNWQSGAILVQNSGIFNQKTGMWNIQCDQSINPQYGDEAFINAGLFRKLSGSNTTSVNLAFDNTGSVEVDEGRLQLNAGGSAGGTFDAATNSVIRFANGSFVFSGVIEGPGSVTFGSVSLTLLNTLMTVSNANSVIQINPTNQTGMYSWMVDGVEQLNQKWFWLRQGTNHSQVSLDNLGATLLTGSSPSNNATAAYLAPGLNASFGFTLTGGASGSHVSQMAESITLQNTTNIPLSLHLFEYSDFDLAGEAAGDSVSFLTTNTVIQQGKGMTLMQTAQTAPPSFWEASWYSITLDDIIEDASLTLSDAIIPQGAGDQTFAFEWDFSLGAGQTYVVNLTDAIGPTPSQLSIALSNGNAVISWPTNSLGIFQLQGATALGASGGWTAVTNPPAIVGEHYQVTAPCSETAMFYRLLQ